MNATPGRMPAYLALMALSMVGTTASAQTAGIEISGGPDPSGHEYTWTVVNHGDSPIVACEIPHCNANFFIPPDGWDYEITNKFYADGKAGACIGRAASSRSAVKPGQSAVFVAKIGPRATPRGQGSITFTLADGSRISVAAQVAVPESVGAQFMPLIGLGAVLLVFLIVRQLRKGRVSDMAETGTDEPS